MPQKMDNDFFEVQPHICDRSKGLKVSYESNPPSLRNISIMYMKVENFLKSFIQLKCYEQICCDLALRGFSAAILLRNSKDW